MCSVATYQRTDKTVVVYLCEVYLIPSPVKESSDQSAVHRDVSPSEPDRVVLRSDPVLVCHRGVWQCSEEQVRLRESVTVFLKGGRYVSGWVPLVRSGNILTTVSRSRWDPPQVI